MLHDGEPVGQREFRGRQVSVFNELTVLEHSLYRTWVARIEAPSSDAIAEFEQLIQKSEGECEDWTKTVQLLCKACSEGNSGDHHHHKQGDGWVNARELGIALQGIDPSPLLEEWARNGVDRTVVGIHCALD